MYDFSKFHFEVETLKKTLHKNAYPTKFVDKCVAKFVNIFTKKPVFTTVPKLELRIVLPYLGNISSITKKRLNRCFFPTGVKDGGCLEANRKKPQQ